MNLRVQIPIQDTAGNIKEKEDATAIHITTVRKVKQSSLR
jgi:hypothetical protein